MIWFAFFFGFICFVPAVFLWVFLHECWVEYRPIYGRRHEREMRDVWSKFHEIDEQLKRRRK